MLSAGDKVLLRSVAFISDETESINRIIEEWQAGMSREENVRRLFERYYRPVSLLREAGFLADDCHDLTQETFLRVKKNIRRKEKRG